MGPRKTQKRRRIPTKTTYDVEKKIRDVLSQLVPHSTKEDLQIKDYSEEERHEFDEIRRMFTGDKMSHQQLSMLRRQLAEIKNYHKETAEKRRKLSEREVETTDSESEGTPEKAAAQHDSTLVQTEIGSQKDSVDLDLIRYKWPSGDYVPKKLSDGTVQELKGKF